MWRWLTVSRPSTANARQLTKQLHTFNKERSCMQACESLETNVIGYARVRLNISISCSRSCSCVCSEFYRAAESSRSPGKVVLEAINFPVLRYQRRVIRNDLDFVGNMESKLHGCSRCFMQDFLCFTVSLGGIGGLYFGVSLISVIEFLYSVFFKPFYLRVRLIQR